MGGKGEEAMNMGWRKVSKESIKWGEETPVRELRICEQRRNDGLVSGSRTSSAFGVQKRLKKGKTCTEREPEKLGRRGSRGSVLQVVQHVDDLDVRRAFGVFGRLSQQQLRLKFHGKKVETGYMTTSDYCLLASCLFGLAQTR